MLYVTFAKRFTTICKINTFATQKCTYFRKQWLHVIISKWQVHKPTWYHCFMSPLLVACGYFFLWSLTICKMHCFSSSSLLKMFWYSCISFTPLSATSLTTTMLFTICNPRWKLMSSFQVDGQCVRKSVLIENLEKNVFDSAQMKCEKSFYFKWWMSSFLTM